MKQSSLPYKQSRQEEISIDAKAYSVSVGVGKKIPVRANFKIDINNYSSIVKHFTVIAKLTVCDHDYSLLKRTYEVDAGHQVHEYPSFNIEVAPFESPRTCILKAGIESLGKEDNISIKRISYATLHVENWPA